MLKSTLLSISLISAVMAEDEIAAMRKERSCSKKAILTNNNRNGGFVAIDGFYWNASEDGLQYATVATNIVESGPGKGRRFDTNMKSPSFDWAPGFRVEAGYLAGSHAQWVVSAIWTHLNTTAHGYVSGINGTSSLIIPSWATALLSLLQQETPPDAFISANSKVALHYNTYDLMMGHDFFINRKLKACPFLGLRYATIHQYNFSSYSSMLGDTATYTAHSNYDGIGIRAGSDLLWSFTDHWGILGKISASFLYGSVKSNLKLKEIDNDLRLTNRNNFNAGRVNLDGAIGLQWQNNIGFWSSPKCHWSIAALYEVNEWFNQNQFMEFVGVPSEDFTYITRPGNLFLQGFTLRVSIDF